MAERYLIDTSAVIKYLNESFPATGILFMDQVVDGESLLSFISEIELQVWNPPNPDDLKIYQTFVENSTVIGIDEEIKQQTIYIRKTYKLKLPDALIAATALVNNFTLIVDNNADFQKVNELRYINPMHVQ